MVQKRAHVFLPEGLLSDIDHLWQLRRRSAVTGKLAWSIFSGMARSGSPAPPKLKIYFTDFFGVTKALNHIGRSFLAEPLPENGVIALTKSGEELLVSDGRSLAGHGVAPGLPVVFGRVDEGSIHVPEYGTGVIHVQPGIEGKNSTT